VYIAKAAGTYHGSATDADEGRREGRRPDSIRSFGARTYGSAALLGRRSGICLLWAGPGTGRAAGGTTQHLTQASAPTVWPHLSGTTVLYDTVRYVLESTVSTVSVDTSALLRQRSPQSVTTHNARQR